jgi:DNA-binding transcriptional regulator YiaG
MTPAEFTATRNGLGLTVNELARILGVRRNAVIRWEDPSGEGPRPWAVAEMRLLLNADRLARLLDD